MKERQPQRRQKLLFLPFMQIPSGHHQVADTLIDECYRHTSKVNCDKIDMLSYSYGGIEKLVSSLYLSWINNFPNSYHWLYYHSSYKESFKSKRNALYTSFFMYFFKKLLNESNPDIIVCTHALPSGVASRLKQKNKINQTVINVYTDFFINRVWGLKGIDYHLTPSIQVKNYLLTKGIPESKIAITGIPVHPVFREKGTERRLHKLSVLVTGGNLGVGGIEKLINKTKGDIQFYVLCGKNEALYQRLDNNKQPHIIPFRYITSRKKMNNLYDNVDAVLTKPGGVTISECLMKQKPIFIYNPLPGQEKINVEQLLKLGVVMLINHFEHAEHQILQYFTNKSKQKVYHKYVNAYHKSLETDSLTFMIDMIQESKRS